MSDGTEIIQEIRRLLDLLERAQPQATPSRPGKRFDSYPIDESKFRHLGQVYPIRRRQAQRVVRYCHETQSANRAPVIFNRAELAKAAESDDAKFNLKRLFAGGDEAFYQAYFIEVARGGWRIRRAEDSDKYRLPTRHVTTGKK